MPNETTSRKLPRLILSCLITDLAKALGVKAQPFSVAKEDRSKFIAKYLKESTKAGYLLTAESKEVVGVSINQIMDWVVGKGNYSMKALREELQADIPPRRGG